MTERNMSILMRTMDPQNPLGGDRTPALTTLLHRVCDNDPTKFEEATRIIELFIEEARNEARGTKTVKFEDLGDLKTGKRVSLVILDDIE